MNALPIHIEDCKLVTDVKQDVIRAAVNELGTDEILAIKTDCNRDDSTELYQALGRSWRIGFRRHGDWIWRWSGKSSFTVRTVEQPLQDYVSMISNDEPFTWVRYGDGSFGCALNTIYQGFGFQHFTPELRADIHESLVENYSGPRYIMGLAPRYHFTGYGMWGNVVHYLHDNDIDVEWASASTFTGAVLQGKLGPFVHALRNTKTLIVGPPKFAPVAGGVLPDATFLPISPKQCHTDKDAIVQAILAQDLPAVITFSAGPAANTIIHGLYPIIGEHSTMINMGSVWGPFVGTPEHKCYEVLTDELMRRNRGDGLA